MHGPVLAARLLIAGILGLAAYGFWEGTPQDVVNAVRSGNVGALRKAVGRDPAAVHTKVYAQAFERQSDRTAYQARTGRSPWEGKYLIHEAVGRIINPEPMLDALAAAGADLTVRLKGRSLLHLAAHDGNLEVVKWLLDHGADPNARNACVEPCEGRGQTPLHEGLSFRADDMSELLLTHGAAVDAIAANGQTALHLAGLRGSLGGAFVLCRHGADPMRRDAAGKTPHDLALEPAPGADAKPPRSEGAEQFAQWLKPAGGCAIVAAKARTARSPVSDDDARQVFAETVPRRR